MVYIRPIDEKVRDQYAQCDRLLVLTSPSEFPDIKNAAMCRVIHRLLEGDEPYMEDMVLVELPANMPALTANPLVIGELSYLLTQHLAPEMAYNNLPTNDRARIGKLAAEVITASKAYDNVHG